MNVDTITDNVIKKIASMQKMFRANYRLSGRKEGKPPQYELSSTGTELSLWVSDPKRNVHFAQDVKVLKEFSEGLLLSLHRDNLKNESENEIIAAKLEKIKNLDLENRKVNEINNIIEKNIKKNPDIAVNLKNYVKIFDELNNKHDIDIISQKINKLTFIFNFLKKIFDDKNTELKAYIEKTNKRENRPKFYIDKESDQLVYRPIKPGEERFQAKAIFANDESVINTRKVMNDIAETIKDLEKIQKYKKSILEMDSNLTVSPLSETFDYIMSDYIRRLNENENDPTAADQLKLFFKEHPSVLEYFNKNIDKLGPVSIHYEEYLKPDEKQNKDKRPK